MAQPAQKPKPARRARIPHQRGAALTAKQHGNVRHAAAGNGLSPFPAAARCKMLERYHVL